MNVLCRHKPTRQPLMPGRKSRRRMFWAYWWRAVVLMLAWGMVWTAVWQVAGLTARPPVEEWGDVLPGVARTVSGEVGALGFDYALQLSIEVVKWRSNNASDAFYTSFYLLSWYLVLEILWSLLLFCLFAGIVSSFYRKRERIHRSAFILILSACIINSLALTWSLAATERASGLTPLVYTIQLKHWHRAERLLENGADPNTVYTVGPSMTPLSMAASEGNIEMMQALVTHGAIVDPTGVYPLVNTVNGGHAEAAEWLLEQGADIHRGSLIGNAISMAAQKDDAEYMEMLLEYGADVNETGFGLAPLERALWQNCLETAKVLLDHGAERNVFATNPGYFSEDPELDAFLKENDIIVGASVTAVDDMGHVSPVEGAGR